MPPRQPLIPADLRRPVVPYLLAALAMIAVGWALANQPLSWRHNPAFPARMLAVLLLLSAIWRLHRSRKRLAERHDHYQALVEHLPVMIYLDQPGVEAHNLYTSPHSEVVCGYRAEEWAQDPDLFRRIIHPDDLAAVEADLTALCCGQRPTVDSVYRIKAKDGSWRFVHDQAVLIRDQRGQPLYVQGCWQDVSQQKELEQQVAQAGKMEAVGQLAGGIAHDFNNLLQVIGSYAELASFGTALIEPAVLEESEIGESLDGIQLATQRGSTLTRQLLSFSRQDLRRVEPLDLGQVVCGLSSLLRRLLGEQLEIAFTVADGLPLVLADRSQMEQVVVNLAINARDALDVGGHLDIDVRARGAEVILTVQDDGQGMDETTLAHLFEPFYTTKEVGQGTGLGLSTVYGIVEQSEGQIEVSSRVGQGTTIAISLPALGSEPAQRAQLPLAAGASASGSST